MKEHQFSSSIFKIFRDFIEQVFGIFFEDNQKEILRKYLLIRMQALKIYSFEEYFKYLKERRDTDWEYKQLAELITVNETYFFRVPEHFDFLEKDIIPEIVNKKKIHNLRIWSAGCSTGEEPYSIAISILENEYLLKNWQIEIIGTDISQDSLDKAKIGVYHSRPVKYMRQDLVQKYFTKIGDNFKVKDEVKRMVQFRYLNLIKEPFDFHSYHDFDIIFFRNVMIYFKMESIKRIIKNFYKALTKNGILFIGPSETLWGISDDFRTQFLGGSFIYRKVNREKLNENTTINVNKTEIKSPQKLSTVTAKKTLTDLSTSTISKQSFPDFKKKKNATLDSPIECNTILDYLKSEQYILLEKKLKAKESLELRDIIILLTIYLHTNQKAEFINLFEENKRHYILSSDFFFLAGLFYRDLEEHDKAIEYFVKVIYLMPRNIWAKFYLANSAMNIKHYELAKSEYKSLVITINEGKIDNFEFLNRILDLPKPEFIKLTAVNSIKKMHKSGLLA